MFKTFLGIETAAFAIFLAEATNFSVLVGVTFLNILDTCLKYLSAPDVAIRLLSDYRNHE